ncbi:MAG: SDR family NAD(P)-dependent oxidoreductase [Pseudomonadota bacterium]
MTEPIRPPGKKDPVARTRLPTLPPSARSREALGLVAQAAEGHFRLQRCAACERFQYPPRQRCHHCLSDALQWDDVPNTGQLLAKTSLHHSNDNYFRERLPWSLGLVRLTCGISVVAHLTQDCPPAASVTLSLKLDPSGRATVVAMPVGASNVDDDMELREMTSHPKHRRALVVNGRTPVGRAMIKALVEAQCRRVYVGDPEPWRFDEDFRTITDHEAVEVFPLDVTDSRSVHELAGRIGSKVEILINNNYFLRPGGIGGRKDVNFALSEMEVNYLGLLRLAREFSPVMRARGADGTFGAAAWVNVLSIYAIVSHPGLSTFSAAQAAACSAAKSLRHELADGGVKVINVFPGPIEDEWQQLLPPPKLTPDAVAKAVVDSLVAGTEDVYPGPVAQELIARWRENPKEVERELML